MSNGSVFFLISAAPDLTNSIFSPVRRGRGPGHDARQPGRCVCVYVYVCVCVCVCMYVRVYVCVCVCVCVCVYVRHPET